MSNNGLIQCYSIQHKSKDREEEQSEISPKSPVHTMSPLSPRMLRHSMHYCIVMSSFCTINISSHIAICHKLHSAISPSILHLFPRSQSELKALQKTFRSIAVTSRSDQYWPRYQANQLVTIMVPFIKSPISWKPPRSKLRFQASEKPSSYRSE